MTPELTFIIQLFIGFCAVFFSVYYVIQKLVKDFNKKYKGKIIITPAEEIVIENNDHITNPAYSYRLDNMWHTANKADMQTDPVYSHLPNNIFNNYHNNLTE